MKYKDKNGRVIFRGDIVELTCLPVLKCSIDGSGSRSCSVENAKANVMLRSGKLILVSTKDNMLLGDLDMYLDECVVVEQYNNKKEENAK